MKDNVLILRSDARDFFGELIKQRGYKIFDPYLGQNYIFTRFIRGLHFKYNLPCQKIWFNKKVIAANVKDIVIFETQITSEYLTWLNKKIEVNTHIWYWNIVKNTVHPNMVSNLSTQLWSFSSKDCENYDMKFNPPPYFNEVVLPDNEFIFDIVFVGKDKGRSEKLFYYRKLFEDMGLSTYFHIAPDKRWQKKKIHKRRIDYSKTLEWTSKSKAVFDLIEVTDSGQSMRIMETLFLKKKVITNNTLIKNYDFYNKNNIFILNHDNLDELPNFINSPMEDIDNKIVQYYDFDFWVERFINESEE